jgi:hypothetical protein
MAMEGLQIYYCKIKTSFFLFSSNIYKNIFTKNIHNQSSGKLIWVYNILDLSLIDKAPFKTKTECANILKINRSTVAAYLDTNKPYKNKWILNSINLTEQELSK